MSRVVSSNKFDGGMVNDPRMDGDSICRVSKGFDIFTYPYKLVPYNDSKNADTSSSQNQIVNYQYANVSGTFTLFGLGVVSGGSLAKVFKTTSYSSPNWNNTNNSQSSGGGRSTDTFVYYRGYIYGLRGNVAIYKYDVTGNAAWTDTDQALTYTTSAQGLVHSKDDILYIPYDNKIATNNAGSWTVAALTLPTSMIITSICEYGNYLAIGVKNSDGISNSKVYLWDRNSSNSTLSEVIDFGEGALTVLEQLGSYLIGISLLTSGVSNDRLVFRYYTGSGQSNELMRLVSSTTTSYPLQMAKQKYKNRLYFSAAIVLNGVRQQGIWSIGRNTATGPFGITLEYITANNTVLTGQNYNFIIINDYCIISYSDNSSNYAMSVTNDVSSYTTYTTVATYETVINPLQPESIRRSAGSRSNLKQLEAFAISTEPLTSGQSIVAKYRVDGGSWTTIISQSTTGTITTEAVRDSSGTAFTAGREYEFRFESTGGAQITEYKYRYSTLETFF